MTNSTLDPDGLRLPAGLTLAQVAEADVVRDFAAGLLVSALAQTVFSGSLAEALHHPGPEGDPLLAALLVLDAEIEARVGGDRRMFPLPGFLSYRPSLPLDRFPLHSLRLPPLNPGGQFVFQPLTAQSFLAVRLDLHPVSRALGHVRLALTRPPTPPIRLYAVEHLLDRQFLTDELIERAIVAEPLSPAEQAGLRAVLGGLGG